MLGRIAEGIGQSFCPHPGRAADAVHVSLGFLGNVEVHHEGDAFDINARAAMSVATSTRVRPVRKSSSARWRAPCDLFAMDRHSLDSVANRIVGDFVGSVFGARKQSTSSSGCCRNVCSEQAVFVAALHVADALAQP